MIRRNLILITIGALRINICCQGEFGLPKFQFCFVFRDFLYICFVDLTVLSKTPASIL